MKRILFTLLAIVICVGANAQSFNFKDLHGIWIVNGAYVGEEYVTIEESLGFALTNYRTTDIEGMYHSIFMAGDSKLRLPYKFINGNEVVVYSVIEGKIEPFADIQIVSLIPKSRMIGWMSVQNGTKAKLEFIYIEPNE